MRISDWSSDVCSSDLLEKSTTELEALLTKIAVSSMPEHLQETLASADTELEKASGDVAKIEEGIRALENGEDGEIALIHSALEKALKESQVLLQKAITANSQQNGRTSGEERGYAY